MTEPTPRHQRDMRDRVATTYLTAQKAGDSTAAVAIYVAQDVMDWMRDQCNLPKRAWDTVNTAWGYPVFLEEDWESGRIEVHTVRRIW